MSDLFTAKTELNRLNKAIPMYVRASGKSLDDVIKKKATMLAYAARTELKGIAPAKGYITAERLAALKAGEGIRVHKTAAFDLFNKFDIQPTPSGANFRRANGKGKYKGSILINGKHLNIEALAVKRELALRESGRMFTSQSSGFTRIDTQTISKYGPALGDLAFKSSSPGNSAAVFTWGGLSELSTQAAVSLSRAKGLRAMTRAMKATIDDMIPYIDSHLGVNSKVLLQ